MGVKMGKPKKRKLPKPGRTVYVQSAHNDHSVTVRKVINARTGRLLVHEKGLPGSEAGKTYTTTNWTWKPIME